MASYTTEAHPSPPSPSCTLVPQAQLLTYISDNTLAVILPTICYAVAGGFFHLLDVYEVFSNYRIHPSEDELKRNRVTKWQVLSKVTQYHVIQISLGLFLNRGSGPTMVGDEICQIHKVARLIKHTRVILPMILGILGIDAKRLAFVIQDTDARLAHASISDPLSSGNLLQNPAFTAVELSMAKFIVIFGKPMLQYLVALAVVDTWIYFTHRLCHVNKTLYRESHFAVKPPFVK